MGLEFKKVRLADIEEDLANNPRLEFDDAALDDLANSIEKQGLLQPILVRVKTDTDGVVLPGKYVIISGARRYKAMRFKMHLEEIDVGITNSLEDEAERFIAQVQENEQRENLNGDELKLAVLRMHNVYGMSNGVIASRLGKKSANFVSRILSSARPEMEKFSLMCGRSADVLAEIKKFQMPDRERLLSHFEKTQEPFTASQLRKIALVQSAGINIKDMDFSLVLSMTSDEIKKIVNKDTKVHTAFTLVKETSSGNFSSPSSKGKYDDDSDEDDDLFASKVQTLLSGSTASTLEALTSVYRATPPLAESLHQSSWTSSGSTNEGKYDKDDAHDDSIGNVPASINLLDQVIQLKINLKISRLDDVLAVLGADVQTDQIIELPINLKTSRVRELIGTLGGDPTVDAERLVQELTRRLVRG